MLFLSLLLQLRPVLAQITESNALGCATANAIISICHSISPALSTATAFYLSAPCLCYSSSAWAPSIFDNAHTRCYSYLSTASPQYVASATSVLGGPIPSAPCSQVGNLLQASTTATETSLFISQTTDVNYQACNVVQNAARYCQSMTPAFSTMTDPKEQASCLCYSGFLWKPTLFDNAWGSCLKFYSTGAVSQYTALANRPGGITSAPCALAGDVRAGATTADSTPMATPTQTGATATSPTSNSVPAPNEARGQDGLRKNALLVTGGLMIGLYFT